jgi:hypothetical protein
MTLQNRPDVPLAVGFPDPYHVQVGTVQTGAVLPGYQRPQSGKFLLHAGDNC